MVLYSKSKPPSSMISITRSGKVMSLEKWKTDWFHEISELFHVTTDQVSGPNCASKPTFEIVRAIQIKAKLCTVLSLIERYIRGQLLSLNPGGKKQQLCNANTNNSNNNFNDFRFTDNAGVMPWTMVNPNEVCPIDSKYQARKQNMKQSDDGLKEVDQPPRFSQILNGEFFNQSKVDEENPINKTDRLVNHEENISKKRKLPLDESCVKKIRNLCRGDNGLYITASNCKLGLKTATIPRDQIPTFDDDLFSLLDQEESILTTTDVLSPTSITYKSLSTTCSKGKNSTHLFEIQNYNEIQSKPVQFRQKRKYTKHQKKVQTDIGTENQGGEENDYHKPPLPYNQLIYLAFKQHHFCHLTVRMIYKFIRQWFPYYENANLTWQNAIRHQLCCCKDYEKIILDPDSIAEKGGKCAWKVTNQTALKKLDDDLVTHLEKADVISGIKKGMLSIERFQHIFADTIHSINSKKLDENEGISQLLV